MEKRDFRNCFHCDIENPKSIEIIENDHNELICPTCDNVYEFKVMTERGLYHFWMAFTRIDTYAIINEFQGQLRFIYEEAYDKNHMIKRFNEIKEVYQKQEVL